ncbi:MAG TPA: hypothetical protein VF652_04725 [Allosphingosinicella sp.]|jgi:hypothetical protein
MEKFAFALAVLALSAPAAAAPADKDVAPAVTRIPSKASGPAACGPSDSTPCPSAASSAGRAQRYRSALESVRPAGDIELNSGVAKVMGDLMAAGRCGDAVSLAKRDGRNELAARAEQLCK